MEHDLSATHNRPPDRFWVAPALMADHNTEGQGTGLEDMSAGAGRVGALFRGVNLDLVLKPKQLSVAIDNENRDPPIRINESVPRRTATLALAAAAAIVAQARSRNAGSTDGTTFPMPR